MSTVADTAAVAKPAHGGHCPICNTGILFLIAETDEGEYLACFNCDTRGTVHKTEEWVPSVDPTTQSPTGFTVAHDQLAAKREAGIDIEQAAARSRAAGSPPPATGETVEPHEQHDLVPPADEQQQQQQEGENA